MRIVVNGQQAFGKAVLDALVERGEDVVAVYVASKRPGGRPDPLKEAAVAHGVAVYEPTTFKTSEVHDEMKALKPDLCVMAFVTLIVPEEFLDIPLEGTIQYHPSLLPRHRGPSAINWAIIQGETRTGLTIFWPDQGLDTGPILMQKEVGITEEDTLGSVYFESLFPMGIEAMVESVDLVRDGNAPRIPQDETQASYESWCTRDEVRIGWDRPLDEVYNLIRGANPQPGAWTICDGKTLQIYEVGKSAEAGGEPGEVVDVTEEGFAVAAPGGRVLVKRVRPEGGDKIAAGAFAAEGGPATGTRLG
jgi:methionyl-tRNA formyltransferase